MLPPRTARAVELMTRFAQRTGLTGAAPPRRYLWTDAFAVCNFLSLARATGDGGYVELALRLVDQVHQVLGRHRSDDDRAGWLSGRDGERHPTRGGLRIGKRLPERRVGERVDERLEWDRDGQYFHYLTKWMHALDQVARATGQATFDVWARELAATAHRAFVHGGRMWWKASIDLSRAQVPSMGQHDPLDGLVTCVALRATATRLGASPDPSLEEAIAAFAAMVDPHHLTTTDPLGLGGLLVDAARIAQLESGGAWTGPRDLLDALVESTVAGLRTYLTQPELRAPAEYRLAFRELGLAIGLAAVGRLPETVGARLAPYARLHHDIESFWLVRAHRATAGWRDHADINDVMLATSLAPDGFLDLG